MTAKATPAATPPKEPSETAPKIDLSHVRVGPPFVSDRGGRCLFCDKPTEGTECRIVENTRSGKKRAAHTECFAGRPEVLARADTKSADDFLAA